MNIWIKLINIAKELDHSGLHAEADTVDQIIRIAQYSGPTGTQLPPLNIQMGIPMSKMNGEYEDVAKKRQEYNPRTREPEYEEDDPSDERELAGSLTGMNSDVGPGSGITRREMDNGAGYKGIDNMSMDQIQKDRNNKGFPSYSPY